MYNLVNDYWVYLLALKSHKLSVKAFSLFFFLFLRIPFDTTNTNINARYITNEILCLILNSKED